MKQGIAAAVLATLLFALAAGCASVESPPEGSTVRPRSVWGQDPLYGAPPP